MNSDYKLIKDDSTSCHCGSKNIFLLKNVKTMSQLPSFYICFDCHFIGEIGIGIVLTRKNK